MTWGPVVSRYVDDVLEERILVGSLTRASVLRYVDDLQHAAERGIVFNTRKAEQMISIWPNMFIHTTGEYAGKSFIPYPWQAFALWNIFGWDRVDTGFRRFRSAFISVARGNGKSPFAAALLLTLFAFDWPVEKRAECYCLGTAEKQSRIVFNEAVRMVQQHPELRRLIQVYKATLSIAEDDSILSPLASDSKNTDGLVIHGVVCDELHAWREQHRELWEKIETACGKRRQPLRIMITTAGNDESDLWREQHDFSSAAASRLVSADDHFSLIYEIDDDDDPLDDDVWIKANPMLPFGVVKADFLRSMSTKARTQPENFLPFKRYHCNKRVQSATKVITPEMWRNGDWPLPDFDNKTVYLGFDWGWRDDLAALGIVHPIEWVEDEHGSPVMRYAIDARVWCPRGCKRDLAREPWASWIARGQLILTAGDTTDVAMVYREMNTIRRRYQVRSCGYDPNNAREFSTRCENDYGIKCFPIAQSTRKMNEATRELLNALRQGRICHGGNELLGWCAQNLACYEDTEGYMRPVKKRSEDKIDPIVAIIMALNEAMFAERKPVSIYETRGPLIL